MDKLNVDGRFLQPIKASEVRLLFESKSLKILHLIDRLKVIDEQLSHSQETK